MLTTSREFDRPRDHGQASCPVRSICQPATQQRTVEESWSSASVAHPYKARTHAGRISQLYVGPVSGRTAVHPSGNSATTSFLPSLTHFTRRARAIASRRRETDS